MTQFFALSLTRYVVACLTSLCATCRPASKYCVYMDKQMKKLCRFHMEAKHVKINAEKVPYLCEKLNIVTLPSVVLVKNRKVRYIAMATPYVP